MWTTKVVCQGIAIVEDGRLFVVDSGESKNGGKPILSPPEIEFLDPEVKILGPATSASTFMCARCGELQKRQLISHTYSWMYAAFICPNHRKELLLDVFPKLDSGTEWDWTNALVANLDSMSNPAAPRGVEITNRIGPGTRYEQLLKNLENYSAYILTPTGIIVPRQTLTLRLNFFTRLIKKIKSGTPG